MIVLQTIPMSDFEAMDYVAVAIIVVAVAVIAMLIFIGHRVSENSKDSDENEEDMDGREDERTTSENNRPVETINVNSRPMNAMNKYEDMNNAVLIRAILGDLSCQYDENEDGTIFFVYQGERFWVSASENSVWIRIIDMRWYDCSLDKLEEMSCMQKAINTANSRQACTALYAISKEDNEMIVYSKCDIIIASTFPAPDQYFAAWLANFFRLKQEVVIEFEKEKQKIGLSEN